MTPGSSGARTLIARELLPGHVLQHRHRGLARRGVDLGGQALAARVVQGREPREVGQDGRDVGGLVPGQQQAKRRAVGGEHHAVAVEDQPARRRGEQELELIVFGEHPVAPGFQQLEVRQPGAQGDEAQARRAAEQEGAPVEQALALVHLVEVDGRSDHRKRASAAS